MPALPNLNHQISVGSAGTLQIGIAELSQDWIGNTSQVQVYGVLVNNAPGNVATANSDVTCSISGDQSFTGSKFGFSLKSGGSIVFIDHIFTVEHGADGTQDAHFQVTFGDTGTSTFGSGTNTDATLTLARIPKRPSQPGSPTLTDIRPTSLVATWAGSDDDNASSIVSYTLRCYEGDSATGDYTSTTANNFTRNVGGLIAGKNYTFTVVAKNNSGDNGGYSDPSAPVSIQMQGGAWIRLPGVDNAGHWVLAVTYVRYEGDWHLATPYVRDSGSWKQTF